MAYNVEIALTPELFCKRCPNNPENQSISEIHNGQSPLPTCPRDALVEDIGNNPRPDQLLKAIDQYGLIFSNNETERTSTSFTNIECPNAEDGVPGLVIIQTKIQPRKKLSLT